MNDRTTAILVAGILSLSTTEMQKATLADEIVHFQMPPLGNTIHPPLENKDFADIIVDPEQDRKAKLDPRKLRFQGCDFHLGRRLNLAAYDARSAEWALNVVRTANIIPLSRHRHYEWCNRPDLAIVGWSSTIRRITNDPRGMTVEVSVTPKLQSATLGCPVTLDVYIENYLIDADSVCTFVEGYFDILTFRRSVFGM